MTTTTERPTAEAVKPMATGAVGLVLVTTLLFWAVGGVRGDDASVPTVANGLGTTQVETPDASDPAAGPGSTDPGTTAPVVVEPKEGAPSASGTASPEPAEASPSTAVETPDRAAAAKISIQVLDAVLDDNGKAAKAVAGALSDAGYKVVVVNKAIKVYEKTTVFYVGDHADAGKAVADRFRFTVVEPKPDNLSSSVDLHIVVGRDQR